MASVCSRWSASSMEIIREMVSFELGKEIKKDVFCHVTSLGQRKILNLQEESKLRTLDSALWCSTTEPQRLYGEWGLLWRGLSWSSFLDSWWGLSIVSLSHAPDKTKTSFSSSMEILKGAAVCSTTQVWKFFKYRCCHSNLSLSSYVTFWITVAL